MSRIPPRQTTTYVFYAEFSPSLELAHAVRCIWVFESHAGANSLQSVPAEPQRIVPDGHPELVLHYGDSFRETGDETPQPHVLFAGQIAKPLMLQAGAHAGVIGVRFLPAAARTLLGIPMRELTDARLDLAQVWGRDADLLADEVAETQGVENKVRRVEQAVSRRLAASRVKRDPLVEQCVTALDCADTVRVEELVRQSRISVRQLERRFHHEVGVPPRLLSSILRFRRIFDVLEYRQPARWVEAALAAGYFDQAHMIRDFRRFAGCTPREYLQSSPGLATALATAR